MSLAKRKKLKKGGDMTPEEQKEVNELYQEADAAQDMIVKLTQDKENELAAQQRAAHAQAEAAQKERERLEQQLRAREAEFAAQKAAQEQQLRAREAELAVQTSRARRADEMYDRLAYDRINSYVLGYVPLNQRLRLSDTIAALTRAKLLQGEAETDINRELVEQVKKLTETVAKRAAPKKRSSKKKKAKSSKKKKGKK